jgi:hypothetical protein
MADPAPQTKPVLSQRITVREIPDPPIVREIKQREVEEDSDPNMFIDTEALERSYLDSLGIDTHGIEEQMEELSPVAADRTHELPGYDESTVAIDASDLEAELHAGELNTVVLDTRGMDLEALDAPPTAAATAHNAPAAASDTITVSSPIAIDGPAAEPTVLDYNLLDLDATAQHVQMPSELNDQVVVSERRTNIIDVLRSAIDRDPHRRDLRMKLIETYYSAASVNQRAFLEVVRKLARDRDFLSGDDWKKVMMMGRDIAAEDILFADPAKGDDLADCA